MRDAPRRPPSRLASAIRRTLTGGHGAGGFALQLVLLLGTFWMFYAVASNARENLSNQHIATGFGFLWQTAGFAVNQALIPFTESDTYLRVFVVGLLNTLSVSIIGIVFATIIGFLVGIGRLSPNWLVSRLCGAYVEALRNLPLLFQIFFWYLAVLSALPGTRNSISIGSAIFLNNRGLVVPHPVTLAGFYPWIIALTLGIAASIGLVVIAIRHHIETGHRWRIWPYILALLFGLPIAAVAIWGKPLQFELPVLRGFNFAGGTRVIPELVALAVALSTYTGAYIAESVRSGIQSVSHGQMEAGASLGLRRGTILRLIVVPQAMRVILPPLTNQYLNLIKNSSLAVAIGYPEIFSVFAGTVLSQTGQAIEIIAMTMGIYLLISLITSAIMNFYGWRLQRTAGRG